MGFLHSKNIANFETFCQVISSSTNLLSLKSDNLCFHILGSVLDKWEKARISTKNNVTLKLTNATVKAVVCSFPLDEGRYVFHSNNTTNFQNYQRFYFNNEVGSCQEFEYFGFGGNLNNFRTFEECQIICGHFEGMYVNIANIQ